jgi:LPS export ABC transporter protein LptC
LPAFILLFSCGNQEKKIDTISFFQDDPVMSAGNIDVLFSDSGRIQARVTSPLLNRYGGQYPYMEFPKGFRILMYDSAMKVTSSISGNKGIRKDNLRIMEAWGNVIVRNEYKNEQLNTEHLIWDQNKRRIWSDVKVMITTPDKVLYGDRMESNEGFSEYSIVNVSGQMMVQKDSI